MPKNVHIDYYSTFRRDRMKIPCSSDKPLKFGGYEVEINFLIRDCFFCDHLTDIGFKIARLNYVEKIKRLHLERLCDVYF